MPNHPDFFFRQRSDPINFRMDNSDFLLLQHKYQYIVNDLNQYIQNNFDEIFFAVLGIKNFVDFTIHVSGSFTDPVVNDLPEVSHLQTSWLCQLI